MKTKASRSPLSRIYEKGRPSIIKRRRIFKPWVEGDENGIDNDDGDVTWNDWASDAMEWTTAGCASADDGGSDNSGDGTGADRKATAESTVDVTASGWYSWTISNALAQGWYDETINENGVFMLASTAGGATGNNVYASCENATAANRPRFSFTYTTGGGAPAARRDQVIMIQ